MKNDRQAGSATQTWDPQTYADHGRFVGDLGLAVVDLLGPQRGERILDVGCGDGVLSHRLTARGATVVGVDSSPGLVAAARAAGIDARLGDAGELGFKGEFDAVFSNAALHWMCDIDAVLRGVHRALKPTGRFVGEFGGHGNVAAIRTALRAVLSRRALRAADPWYFPTADAYAATLAAHSFAVRRCVLFARPTALPTGLFNWLETFANPFLVDVDGPARAEILAEVIDLLTPILRDDRGRWTADYVRLRFAATRA